MQTFTGLGDVVVALPEIDKVVHLTQPRVWAFAKYCLSVKPPHDFAEAENFDLDTLGRWRDHLMLVDYIESDDDFLYRLYGTGIQEFTGFDMTGRRVSDFDSEVGRFFHRLYTKCIGERCLIYSEHGSVHARRPCNWYRVLCPVQDGGRLYIVVCNYPIAKAAEGTAAIEQRRVAC